MPETDRPGARIGRRDLLRTAGLSAVAGVPGIGLLGSACSPAAAPGSSVPAAPAPEGEPDWEADWSRLVADAKKEGSVTLHTIAGTGHRQVADAFEQAFPGITVDWTGLTGGVWAQKILQERKAGVYNWDVSLVASPTALPILLPEGVFNPVRPLLFRPDVVSDAAWNGGFEAGFTDSERKYAFSFGWNLYSNLFINTDLAPDIRTGKDILDPKWRGKIIVADPRAITASISVLALMRMAYGDDAVKRILVDQQPAFSRDQRQMNEGLIRGQYAIAVGTIVTTFQEFQAQGLGKNVKNLFSDDIAFLYGDTVWAINRGPHPNAAKLYANWLLTKEGQTAYSKFLKLNSRRTDVEIVDAAAAPPPGAEKRFKSSATPEVLAAQEETWSLAEGLLK